jgi:hypothetical protein
MAMLLCASTFSAAAAGGDIEDLLQTMLVYVKIKERLDGGLVLFLIDKIIEIGDAELPNGYELYNEEEGWMPYVANEDTSCSMWFFSKESAS